MVKKILSFVALSLFVPFVGYAQSSTVPSPAPTTFSSDVRLSMKLTTAYQVTVQTMKDIEGLVSVLETRHDLSEAKLLLEEMKISFKKAEALFPEALESIRKFKESPTEERFIEVRRTATESMASVKESRKKAALVVKSIRKGYGENKTFPPVPPLPPSGIPLPVATSVPPIAVPPMVVPRNSAQ